MPLWIIEGVILFEVTIIMYIAFRFYTEYFWEEKPGIHSLNIVRWFKNRIGDDEEDFSPEDSEILMRNEFG